MSAFELQTNFLTNVFFTLTLKNSLFIIHIFWNKSLPAPLPGRQHNHNDAAKRLATKHQKLTPNTKQSHSFESTDYLCLNKYVP